jgi:hypothetical protein
MEDGSYEWVDVRNVLLGVVYADVLTPGVSYRNCWWFIDESGTSMTEEDTVEFREQKPLT